MMKMRFLLPLFLISLTFAIPSCDDSSSSGKKEVCDNQTDDDGDGYTDCEDQDCWSNAACQQNNVNNTNNTNNTNNQNPEICDNQADDDGDGFADCNDADCVADPACEGREICNNQADDDGDGFADCEDQDCFEHQSCNYSPEICDDGIDNDGDGLVDCNDFMDCMDYQDCLQGEICNNQTDDDNDGLVDCEDDDCIGFPGCGLMPEVCDNRTDDDNDGLVDCEDDDCVDFPGCGPTSCDPLSQTGCVSPDACYVDAQMPEGYCAPAGTTATGSRCTAMTDCIPGDACVGPQNNRVCRLLCLLGDGSNCPQGTTCQQSQTLASTTYGVCR